MVAGFAGLIWGKGATVTLSFIRGLMFALCAWPFGPM